MTDILYPSVLLFVSLYVSYSCPCELFVFCYAFRPRFNYFIIYIHRGGQKYLYPNLYQVRRQIFFTPLKLFIILSSQSFYFSPSHIYQPFSFSLPFYFFVSFLLISPPSSILSPFTLYVILLSTLEQIFPFSLCLEDSPHGIFHTSFSPFYI